MFVLGMDMGYSNLKIVWDDQDIKHHHGNLSVGRSPGRLHLNSNANRGGFKMIVDGQENVKKRNFEIETLLWANAKSTPSM